MRHFTLVMVLLPAMGLAQVDLQLTPVQSPAQVVDIKHAGDGSGRLFFVSRTGTVRILDDGMLLTAPFVDVSDRISGGGERGLLSMAFAPDFADSGRFYLYYTDSLGTSTIARFAVGENPDRADPDSAEVIFLQGQPQANHNGGRLEFGPDGYLYLGLGDGGGGGDPQGAGQDTSTLLGKVIRIDVSTDTGYAVPVDNPFTGDPAIPDEIWAYGVRNPWRIAFDRANGDLYIADVGQNTIEEINVQTQAEGGGQNYGWNIFEGSLCFQGQSTCDAATGLTPPVFEYDHEQGCSITGGQVYRGPDYPALFGEYLYGDFCSGMIWGLRRQGGGWSNRVLAGTGLGILTFGEDERGNVYVAGIQGVFLLSDGPPVTQGEAIAINRGMSGAWFDSATPGQGFLVEVEPESGFVFVAWFTYDRNSAKVGAAGQRWLTAQGPFSDTGAQLQVFETAGGAFDSPVATETRPVGTLDLRFADCSSAVVTYDLPDDSLQGEIQLQRLIPGTEALCESLAQTR